MNNRPIYESTSPKKADLAKFLPFTFGTILISLLLYRILLIYSYNGEVGGFDNNFVYDVMRSLKGINIYTNPSQRPYAITLYPPIYYNICTTIGKLIHINTDNPINVYRLCRLVSLLCDCCTGFLFYLLLRRNFFLTVTTTLFLTTAFTCVICYLGYTFSRCDSVFLTFYLLHTFVLTSNKERSTFFYPAGLALLAVICFFAKQNGIIVPFLTTSWLMFKKEKRLALKFWLYYLVIFAIAWSAYIYIFNYKFLFDNIIRALHNRIDLAWFYTYIFKRLLDSIWMIPLYAAFIISVQNYFKPKSEKDKLLAIVFLLQSVFSLGTCLKWGSGAGYFNESILLSFILIGNKLNELSATIGIRPHRKIVIIFTPLLILFAIYTNAQGYLFFIQNKAEKKLAYEQQIEVCKYLKPKLKNNFVLDKSWPWQNFFKVSLSQNIVVPNDDMVACCTFPDHTFDYKALTKDMTNGSISYLILADTSLPKEAWGATLQNFEMDTIINRFVIFKNNDYNP